ncbi:MAG: 16S rRNA (guanine(527)-N(7))-methyltransferase RsmG [Deltaproteobacteria bacterium]|nr:16S rRNA (guanine(527)-N(7))-methyltransferase RsmG [Deltaproteobacteria bacterium]
MIDIHCLRDALKQRWNLELKDEASDLLKKHFAILLEWNRIAHLCSAKGIENATIELYLDSFAITPLLQKEDRLNLMDIGSGGGFPAIPLAILFPQHHFYLVESREKKGLFLKQVIRILKLKNVTLLSGYVSPQHDLPIPQQSVRYITLRGVRLTKDLWEGGIKYLRPDGAWLIYSGTGPKSDPSLISAIPTAVAQSSLDYSLPGLTHPRRILILSST